MEKHRFRLLMGFLIILFSFTYSTDTNAQIPYFNSNEGNTIEFNNLPGGPFFIRADETADVFPLLGEYRYPTMYDGRFANAALNNTLNSTFYVPMSEKTGAYPSNGTTTANSNQPYYHLVDLGTRSVARNIMELSYINEGTLKDIYNGNGEWAFSQIPTHQDQLTGNEYYWIQDIAYYTGGIADNAENNALFNSTNPTWLRFARTSWPDIKTFKHNGESDTIELNQELKFYLDGWEYVSQNRTKVDYKISVTFDGAPSNPATVIGQPPLIEDYENWSGIEGDPIPLVPQPAPSVIPSSPYATGESVYEFTDTVYSNKAAQNRNYDNLTAAFSFNEEYRNPEKLSEYEVGYYRKTDTGSFIPQACGTYTIEVLVEDEVKRYATKTITIDIPCCVDYDGNAVPCDEEQKCEGEECLPPKPPTTEFGSCKIDIQVNEGTTMESNPDDMLANPEGTITEDEETSSSIFDVLTYGIPTDEMLKLFAKTERYLSDFIYQQMEGLITYTINVEKTYTMSWSVPYSCGTEEEPDTCYSPRSDSETVDTDIDEVHPFSYWQIGKLAIYEFKDFTFENYAIPNGKVIVDNNRHFVIVEAEHSTELFDHLFPKNCDNITLGSQHLNGGNSRPSVPMGAFLAEARAAVTAGQPGRIPDVKNDLIKMTIKSKDRHGAETVNETTTYMDNTLTASNGPTPIPIPKSDVIDLEKRNQYIEKTKVNKWQTESKLTAKYIPHIQINAPLRSKIEFSINSNENPDKINKVTVHTPVVMYGQSSDDKAHDQRTNPPKRADLQYTNNAVNVQSANPDSDRHAYILDRPFTVVLPTAGQHINQSGYGNRDFEKYYKAKQVKFPFDVYTENKEMFFPKETWINIPVGQESANFFMPVWVPEGKYSIEYRGIAINAPEAHVTANAPKEREANLNETFRTENQMMDHHIAFDTIEVDVVGRLYDLRITDILDYEWQDVFRSNDGLLTHTGRNYWVGTNKIDGQPRGNVLPMMLPVKNGSHAIAYPNEKLNVAIKTGYQFRYDFKTKGNMFNHQDAIRITPSFYFVDKKTGNREAVDLYYHNDKDYFVKIGSDADMTYREIKLNDLLRGVPEKDLTANADYIYRHIDSYTGDYLEAYDEVGGIKESFFRRYHTDLSKRPVATGSYGFQILNQSLNTFIGPEETNVPACSGASNCTMVPAEDIVAREQHWYGEYSLPAEVYAVKKQVPVYDENGQEIEQVDTIAGYGREHRLNKNSLLFKKDGYIVVNFNIETIVNGNTGMSHLTYHTSPVENAPLNNQWKMEGFAYEVVDGYGVTHKMKDGDMVYYHADRSSFDDFNSNVTH